MRLFMMALVTSLMGVARELFHGILILVARCLRNAMEIMSMDLVPVVKPKKPSCTRR